jgi:hypothetical protein
LEISTEVPNFEGVWQSHRRMQDGKVKGQTLDVYHESPLKIRAACRRDNLGSELFLQLWLTEDEERGLYLHGSWMELLNRAPKLPQRIGGTALFRVQEDARVEGTWARVDRGFKPVVFRPWILTREKE